MSQEASYLDFMSDMDIGDNINWHEEEILSVKSVLYLYHFFVSDHTRSHISHVMSDPPLYAFILISNKNNRQLHGFPVLYC